MKYSLIFLIKFWSVFSRYVYPKKDMNNPWSLDTFFGNVAPEIDEYEIFQNFFLGWGWGNVPRPL